MTKAVKQIISLFLALCLFAVGIDFWRYILIRDDTSYTRVMMHQMYTSKENIDVLFVGSSHVYRSFVPHIIDEGLGAYTFNAGSSSQFMDGSLAIIKEVARRNDLKQVYLEMYYGIAEGKAYKEREELTSTYILSDYMPLSFNKIQYLTQASSNQYWINSFIVARRNWKKIFDLNYVKEVIASKQTVQYKNYEGPKVDAEEEYYDDRGFVACNLEFGDKKYFNSPAKRKIEMGSIINKENDWYDSVSSIVNYCNKNEIELYFIVVPEQELTLVGKGNYQEYHDFPLDIANEKKVDFYDFNLCRNQYFDINDGSLFKDDNHLNTAGAELFSTLFSDVLSGRLSVKDVLYDSFAEKIADEDNPFYGIAGPLIDESGNRKCRIVSGSNHFSYQVIEINDDGNKIVLKEFDDSKEFVIPAGDKGKLSIVCKDLKTTEVLTIEIDF